MTLATVLLVDDDDTFREIVGDELRERGYEVSTAASAAQSTEMLDSQPPDVAIVDLRLPDGDGVGVLRHAREHAPRTEVVMLTGHGTIGTAIEAMRIGAFDYLRKPCPIEELLATLGKALERQALIERNTILRSGLAPPDMRSSFVGQSAAFLQVNELIDRVAPTEATVLILGETGVGKEVAAKLIHSQSARREQPLVVVDCSTLHDDLLQSELFGHEKGAYTGASQPKHGLFEVANEGTILLDEIGDVSLQTQTKLLRVIETGCFRHVGGTREIKVDVRIIAATNRDLHDMMRQGQFRSDLYYRLSTIRVEVPPLRERPEDIPVLAECFLERFNSRMGRQKRLSERALALLKRHSWPGNVRELLHALERAVVLCPSAAIDADHLPPDVRRAEPAAGDDELLPLAEVERRHICRVLERVGGNRSLAAKVLGIGERTLYRKIREYEES